MSNPILIERGVAFQVAGSGKVNKNAVKIQYFDLKPHGGKGKRNCEKTVALLQNISITRNNITSQINGLDGVKAIYTGGEDFGTCEINVLILTGGSKGSGLHPKRALESFRRRSLATSTAPINVTWGTYSFKLYLTGLQLQTTDPMTGNISAQLTGTIAPVANK